MKEIWKWLLAGLIVILGSVVFLTAVGGLGFIISFLLLLFAKSIAPYIPNSYPAILGWTVLIGFVVFSFIVTVQTVKKEVIDKRIK